MSTPPCWLTVDGIPVPPAIAAEGGDEVEMYVAEERARAAAIDDVTSPVSTSNRTIPTDAEGAES